MPDSITVDVLVVGAGGAGIYAALEASRTGAEVFLLDKSMIGVGGATVMAQMTVAAALGHAEPDDTEAHFADTVAGGRGIVDESLAALLCEGAPRRIMETLEMGVRWAKSGDGLAQVAAPGHSRRRCCYVDPLATGTALTRGLKAELRRRSITNRATYLVTDLVQNDDQRVVGASALDVMTGEPVAIWASVVVLACGGLTELYQRSSASLNMTGDSYALGLRAGAELVDVEFVQFFPIANLAPRLVGLDPIMWDPFRYKLGGRLLNGNREEFIDRYAEVADAGHYTATRDVLSYAIIKEVEAGRGSPNGGAWLDFTDLTEHELRAAFNPIIDRLVAQGIDLTSRAVEVAPMAHYTLGGLRVDAAMQTTVAGLYAAGEATGGTHGANRLSGNAISEALVFGARAGERAGAEAMKIGHVGPDVAGRACMARSCEEISSGAPRLGQGRPPRQLREALQEVMSAYVGPIRTSAGLGQASKHIDELDAELAEAPVGGANKFNIGHVERIEMRKMIDTARAVVLAAQERQESRGAHQREDYPDTDERFERNSVVSLVDGRLSHRWTALPDPVTLPTPSRVVTL